MPEEQNLDPVEEQDSQVTDADSHEGTPAADEQHSEDWESRYKETQAEYTRSQQELADHRAYLENLQSNEDEQRRFIEQLGYEIPQQKDEEYVDPGEAALAKVQEIEARQQQAEQQAQEEAQLEAMHDTVDDWLGDLEEKEGELNDAEYKYCGDLLMRGEAQSADEAYTRLREIQQTGYDRIVKSKKAPRAPQGQAGSPKFDPSNPDEVNAAVLHEVEAAMAESD